jgi:hypothetical protein
MAGKGGKRIGAGRKPKATEENLAAFWKRELPPDKRAELVRRFYTIAIESLDLKAAISAGTLLLAYSIGKPTEKHEHSNPDGSPLLQPVSDALVKIYGATSSNK